MINIKIDIDKLLKDTDELSDDVFILPLDKIDIDLFLDQMWKK